MKRFTAILLASLSLAGSASAQTKVVAVGERPVADVERSFHLESGASETGNWALLQPEANASDEYYSFYFPGKQWRFDDTMAVTRGQRRYVGNGRAYPDKGATPSEHVGNYSGLVWGGGTITFNGTSITAATSGASATITVSGATVQDEDVFHTVEITNTSGNWTKGIYHIESVNEGSNTWTLDRACSTNTATGMTGAKKGTLWRDSAFGNVYEGLNFLGTTTWAGTPSPSNRAAIGLQVSGEHKGKTVIRDDSFANFDVAMLFGEGLAAFAPDTDADQPWGTLTPPSDYAGKTEDQADVCTIENIIFQGNRYGIVIRANQSIAHKISSLLFLGSGSHGRETALYVERGGRLTANEVNITSGFVNGPTLLRLGGSGGSNAATITGPIVVSGAILDAPSPDLRLLEMDGTGNPECEVVLRDIRINSTQTGTNRTFNGSTLTATADEDSKTITITGASAFVPADNDECLVLHITGGTGFIPGHYSVKEATGGTWTLDRVCTTASASGMTGVTANGFYRGPIVTVKDGINLVLENVTRLTPGCLKITDAGGTFKGSIIVRNCGIYTNSTFKHQPQIVVDDSSTADTEFVFENCYVVGGARCRNGTWVPGSLYGTGDDDGWVTPNLEDLQDQIDALP